MSSRRHATKLEHRRRHSAWWSGAGRVLRGGGAPAHRSPLALVTRLTEAACPAHRHRSLAAQNNHRRLQPLVRHRWIRIEPPRLLRSHAAAAPTLRYIKTALKISTPLISNCIILRVIFVRSRVNCDFCVCNFNLLVFYGNIEKNYGTKYCVHRYQMLKPVLILSTNPYQSHSTLCHCPRPILVREG